MRNIPLAVLTAVAVLLTACSHEAKKETPAAANNTAPAASAPAAKAEPVKAKSATKVECSVKGDNRILEARAHGKGCELAYTKAGKEGTVASASNGTEYCEKALEKLRDKLKASGYDCK